LFTLTIVNLWLAVLSLVYYLAIIVLQLDNQTSNLLYTVE
jgi:hypothetical protein